MHAMSNFYLVCMTYIIYVLVYGLILVAVTRKEFFLSFIFC